MEFSESRGSREPLTVIEWDDLVIIAVEDQCRSGVGREERQGIEGVSNYELGDQKPVREAPHARERRLEDQRRRVSVRGENSGCCSPQRTPVRHDARRIDVRLHSRPVECCNRGRGDRHLRWPSSRATVAWELDEEYANAPIARFVEVSRQPVDQFRVPVEVDEDRRGPLSDLRWEIPGFDVPSGGGEPNLGRVPRTTRRARKSGPRKEQRALPSESRSKVEEHHSGGDRHYSESR